MGLLAEIIASYSSSKGVHSVIPIFTTDDAGWLSLRIGKWLNLFKLQDITMLLFSAVVMVVEEG